MLGLLPRCAERRREAVLLLLVGRYAGVQRIPRVFRLRIGALSLDLRISESIDARDISIIVFL